ncbi:MAG TPA: hypothetical protein ENG48_09225 [Candidatus Atribacteria bacterium]|nr:hypothetical protein [Candidatus Atribacteria bacterium]
MGFKKHNWLEYGRRGNIIEITIRDEVGTKVDFFRVADNVNFKKVARIIRKKYGFNFSPEIPPEKSINNKDKEIKKEKGWLDKDWEW